MKQSFVKSTEGGVEECITSEAAGLAIGSGFQDVTNNGGGSGCVTRDGITKLAPSL